MRLSTITGCRPTKQLNEGIDHIESLPADKFIDAVRSLSQFIATEKLDGSNLIVGIDADGRLYTSREAKGGGTRFYSVNDYQQRAADNGFKGAHAALEAVSKTIATVFAPGDAAEIEVLYGRQPNAIVYGANYIAFLRMITGDNNNEPDQRKVTAVADALRGETVDVTVSVTTTSNGIDMETKDAEQQWRFASVSYVDSKKFADFDLSTELSKFEKYLKQTITVGDMKLTVADLLTIKLTSVPTAARPSVKDMREKIIAKVNDEFKLPIKERILDSIVRRLAPALRDVDVGSHEDIGVEGIVLLHPKTQQQLKIVDKDVFTAINQFNYAIRNQIKSTSRGREMFAGLDLGAKGTSIFDDMLHRIAQAIGIPGLGEYITIKTTLRKFAGDSMDSTVKNVASQVKSPYKSVKGKVIGGIDEGLRDLAAALQKYNTDWKQYRHTLRTGKEIKYTDEIHNRTLTVFAEVKDEMQQMRSQVSAATDIGGIIVALYGKTIKSIH